MTLYHGGKKRIGLEIANVISDLVNTFNDNDIKFKGYCEPFMGMAGVYQHSIDKIRVNTYLGGDANESLIKMWSVKKLDPPKQCSLKIFNKYKNTSSSSPSKGFIGHACGFRGIYFGSFSYLVDKDRMTRQLTEVNRVRKLLNKVKFKAGNYDQFSHLRDFIIYCDPPYEKQSVYYDEDHKLRKFNHQKFWDWCREMSKNNLVLVSEYNAPKDWIKIYQKKEEKLYIPKP